MPEDTDISLKLIERLLELYPPPADARDDVSLLVKLAASSRPPELRQATEQRLAENPHDWLATEVLPLVKLRPWVPLSELQARYHSIDNKSE